MTYFKKLIITDEDAKIHNFSPKTKKFLEKVKADKKQRFYRNATVALSFVLALSAGCASKKATPRPDFGDLESYSLDPVLKMALFMAEKGDYDRSLDVLDDVKDYYDPTNPVLSFARGIVALYASYGATNEKDFRRYLTLARDSYGSLVLINMIREGQGSPLLDLSIFKGIEEAYEMVRD